MCIIVGSSGRNCVLIILFQLYGSKTGLFESNLFWVGQYDNMTISPPPPHPTPPLQLKLDMIKNVYVNISSVDFTFIPLSNLL